MVAEDAASNNVRIQAEGAFVALAETHIHHLEEPPMAKPRPIQLSSFHSDTASFP